MSKLAEFVQPPLVVASGRRLKAFLETRSDELSASESSFTARENETAVHANVHGESTYDVRQIAFTTPRETVRTNVIISTG